MMKQTQWSTIARTVLVLALPIAALADVNGSQTLTNGQSLNLDTGTVISSSGGDIQWTGTNILFQGSAKGGAFPAALGTGPSGFGTLTQQQLQLLLPLASSAAIPASTIPVGTIIGVLTNGGNQAKLLVTAISGTSIALQFTTYGAAASGPTITAIQNNSSSVPAGFPNSGIPPSCLFKIVGTGLAAAGDDTLHSSQGSGLPTTLNGASIIVTVNGTIVHPAMYYATPTQIDAVLPAATPLGSATLTVSYNGGTANATFQVVPSALGIDVYSGTAGVATDNTTGAILTYTNSGKPGETVVLWGTGLGADIADSDTTYTTSPHAVSTPIQAWLGGVSLNILYSGATVYPGVSVIIFTIPASVPSGCYVPFAALTGSGANLTVSNVATFPIMPNGGICADPLFGITGDKISTLTGQTTVKSGSLFVAQQTAPSGTSPVTPVVTSLAAGIFEAVTGASYASNGGVVSIGSCTLSQSLISIGSVTPTFVGLDAGTISLAGPVGNAANLGTIPNNPGFYQAQLAGGAIPSSGGSFVFTGSGGSGANAVGPFTATVNFPNPLLSWTNQAAAATIARSGSLTVTWTGGAPGSYVIISGSSSNGTVSGSYTCSAPQSALQFTVPNYILLGLPTGTGTTSVENATAFSPFTASGLDFGIAYGAVSFAVSTSYN